jgi:hypothetical protein
MRAYPVAVGSVAPKNPTKMPRSQNDRVIQTLSPDRADHTLRVGILPGRSRSRWSLCDPERPRLPAERFPVDRVSIPDQIPRCLVRSAGLEQLAGRPGGRGMLGGIEVQDPPSVVAQDDLDEQHLERRRRKREEVQGYRLLGMIHEKRAPALRRRAAALDHVLGHGGFRDLDPELEPFGMDAWSAPERIRSAHPPNQMNDLGINRWAPAASALPAPIAPKGLAVPTNDRIGLNHIQRISPARPQPRHKNPKEPIAASEPGPRMRSLEHSELLSERQVLQHEIATAFDG